MCILFHKYKITGGWHGHNLMGGAGTCLEKVCKVCGRFKTQTVPGHLDIESLVKSTK